MRSASSHYQACKSWPLLTLARSNVLEYDRASGKQLTTCVKALIFNCRIRKTFLPGKAVWPTPPSIFLIICIESYQEYTIYNLISRRIYKSMLSDSRLVHMYLRNRFLWTLMCLFSKLCEISSVIFCDQVFRQKVIETCTTDDAKHFSWLFCSTGLQNLEVNNDYFMILVHLQCMWAL